MDKKTKEYVQKVYKEFQKSFQEFMEQTDREIKNIIKEKIDDTKKIRKENSKEFIAFSENNALAQFVGNRISEIPIEPIKKIFHLPHSIMLAILDSFFSQPAEAQCEKIRESLVSFRETIQDNVERKFKDNLHNWKEKLKERFIQELEKEHKEKNINQEELPMGAFKKDLRELFYSIEEPEICYLELPENLNMFENLSGKQAESFIQESTDYIKKFQETIESDLKKYQEKQKIETIRLTSTLLD